MTARRWLALAVTIAAAAICYVLYGADPFFGRVTSYSATCLVRSANNACKALGRTLDPSVFQVSVARQQVESLLDHGKRVPFRSCVVASRIDWHCRSVDGSFDFGFTAGRPWMGTRGSEVTDLVFLPRWRYLWLKSGEPHGDLVPSRFQFRR